MLWKTQTGNADKAESPVALAINLCTRYVCLSLQEINWGIIYVKSRCMPEGEGVCRLCRYKGE